MSIVLTAHPIAAIDGPEHITGQLCGGWLNQSWYHSLLYDMLLLKFGQHVVDRVHGPWTVITDQHGRAAPVVLGQHLGAAATHTVSVKLADHLVTQVFIAVHVTWFDTIRFIVLGKHL